MHWLDADYALLQAVLCVMTPRSSAMRARYSRIAWTRVAWSQGSARLV